MTVRLAVRGVILQDDRLLLVNAYQGDESHLWCAPGGGVVAHTGLQTNLRREVYEELGVDITVGDPCMINEFHAPERGFHQVEIFFRASLAGWMPKDWQDTEGVVNRKIWASRNELAQLHVKPDSLACVAWGTENVCVDGLERLIV
jgi:8-oxo-dGTP diphosphatase